MLKALGFRCLVLGFGLYILGTGDAALHLALYVNDLFLMCLRLPIIQWMQSKLGDRFNMKDMGQATFLLGLEICRQDNGDVFLCEEKYAREVLVKFVMEECKIAPTPYELDNHFKANECLEGGMFG